MLVKEEASVLVIRSGALSFDESLGKNMLYF